MKGNFIISVFTILFAAFMLIVSFFEEQNTNTPFLRSSMGWPKLVLLIMLIAGVILLITAYQEYKSTTEKKEQEKKEERNYFIFFFIVILIIIYLILLPYLGFIIISPIIFFLVSIALGSKNIINAIVISIASNLLLVAIFIYALNIPLPKGVGFFNTLSSFIY